MQSGRPRLIRIRTNAITERKKKRGWNGINWEDYWWEREKRKKNKGGAREELRGEGRDRSQV